MKDVPRSSSRIEKHTPEMRLRSGDRVCIIGGGPAGSFAALHLLQLARDRDLDLEVLIFEARHFSMMGPGGCKGCAGILSSLLLKELDRLEISLPEEVVQSELQSYALYIDQDVIQIQQPDVRQHIISIYRGSGPRIALAGTAASFDDFLLAQACARGAQHIASYVRKVQGGERPILSTNYGEWKADLLVLANGVNHKSPLAPVFGYHPPKVEVMAQSAMLHPVNWPAGQVSAFFRQPPGLIFGAVVPKGNYLSISLLGKGFNQNTIPRFVAAHGADLGLVGDFQGLCGCTPRVAISAARRYFGDRWVAVGDAAATRLYKDGIGSASFTAQAAMHTAIMHGVSRSAFRRHYAGVIRQIARDNFYGKLLLRLWTLTLNTPPLLKAWKNAIRRETTLPKEKQVHARILWGMFTGNEPYRDLFLLIWKYSALRSLLRGLLKD